MTNPSSLSDRHFDTSPYDLRVPTRLLPTLTGRHPLYSRLLELAEARTDRTILEMCGDVEVGEGWLVLRFDFDAALWLRNTGTTGRAWVGTGRDAIWEVPEYVETPDHPFYEALVASMAYRFEVPECEVGAHLVETLNGGMRGTAWLKRPVGEIDTGLFPHLVRGVA